MMSVIKFSICKDPNDTNGPYQAVLDPFMQTHRNTTVQLQIIPWDNYKQELMGIALHGQSALVDVSQVGQPVISDLVAMNVIRPFTPRELETFGRASAFIP